MQEEVTASRAAAMDATFRLGPALAGGEGAPKGRHVSLESMTQPGFFLSADSKVGEGCKAQRGCFGVLYGSCSVFVTERVISSELGCTKLGFAAGKALNVGRNPDSPCHPTNALARQHGPGARNGALRILGPNRHRLPWRANRACSPAMAHRAA
jgi:hypothetical protein